MKIIYINDLINYNYKCADKCQKLLIMFLIFKNLISLSNFLKFFVHSCTLLCELSKSLYSQTVEKFLSTSRYTFHLLNISECSEPDFHTFAKCIS